MHRIWREKKKLFIFMFKRQDYSAVFFFFYLPSLFEYYCNYYYYYSISSSGQTKWEHTLRQGYPHTQKKNFSGLWSVMMGTWFPPPHCRCWPCMKQLLNAWELYSVCKPTRVAETPSLFKPLANHLNWLRSIGNSSTKPTTGFLSPSFWSETKMGKERRKKK